MGYDNRLNPKKYQIEIVIISQFINLNVLTLKLYLVSLLIIVAVISIPIISLPGDNFLNLNLAY